MAGGFLKEQPLTFSSVHRIGKQFFFSFLQQGYMAHRSPRLGFAIPNLALSGVDFFLRKFLLFFISQSFKVPSAIRVVGAHLQKRFHVVVVLLSQYKLPNLLLAEAF